MTDTEGIKERAAAAKSLLEDKAFQYAMLELRKRWFHELLENGGGDLAGAKICARINALELVAQELAVLINDYKALVHRGR